MLEDGVGNGSITLMHKVLSAMFNHALSEDYIRRNYAHGCTKELGIYNNKRDALTQAQHAQKIIHRLVAQSLACDMPLGSSYTNPYTKNVTNLHNFYTK